jgi:hypothetical protein
MYYGKYVKIDYPILYSMQKGFLFCLLPFGIITLKEFMRLLSTEVVRMVDESAENMVNLVGAKGDNGFERFSRRTGIVEKAGALPNHALGGGRPAEPGDPGWPGSDHALLQ